MADFLFVLIATAVLIGGFTLQRKLSSKESPWYGLIVPGVMVLSTVLSLVFGMVDGQIIILAYLVFMMSMIYNIIFVVEYIVIRSKKKQQKRYEARLAEIEKEEIKKLGLHPNQKKKLQKLAKQKAKK